MKVAAIALSLVLAQGARAAEGVLVYGTSRGAAGAPDPADLATVGDAMSAALKASGRALVERPIERGLEALQQRAEVRLPSLPRVASGPKRRLSVDTDPQGASVVVDGRAIGRSPLALDVAEGEHAVEALLPAHYADGANVAVGPTGLEVTLTLPVDTAAEAVSRLRLRPERAGLRALAAAAALDGVVLVAVAHDGGERVLVGQRFDGKAGAATRVESVRVTGSLAAGATALLHRLDGAPPGNDVALLEHPILGAPRPPPAAPLPPPAAKKRTPFYLSLYFWGGVFVAGMGAVLAASLVPVPPVTGSVSIDGRAFSGH